MTTTSEKLVEQAKFLSTWPTVVEAKAEGNKVHIKTKEIQVYEGFFASFDITFDFTDPYIEYHFWGTPWLHVESDNPIKENGTWAGYDALILFQQAIFLPAGKMFAGANSSYYTETFGKKWIGRDRFGVCCFMGGVDNNSLTVAYANRDASHLFVTLMKYITNHKDHPPRADSWMDYGFVDNHMNKSKLGYVHRKGRFMKL